MKKVEYPIGAPFADVSTSQEPPREVIVRPPPLPEVDGKLMTCLAVLGALIFKMLRQGKTTPPKV